MKGVQNLLNICRLNNTQKNICIRKEKYIYNNDNLICALDILRKKAKERLKQEEKGNKIRTELNKIKKTIRRKSKTPKAIFILLGKLQLN